MKTNRGRWPNTREAFREIMLVVFVVVFCVVIGGGIVALLMKLCDRMSTAQVIWLAIFLYVVGKLTIVLAQAAAKDVRRQRELKSRKIPKLDDDECTCGPTSVNGCPLHDPDRPRGA